MAMPGYAVVRTTEKDRCEIGSVRKLTQRTAVYTLQLTSIVGRDKPAYIVQIYISSLPHVIP